MPAEPSSLWPGTRLQAWLLEDVLATRVAPPWQDYQSCLGRSQLRALARPMAELMVQCNQLLCVPKEEGSAVSVEDPGGVSGQSPERKH